MKISLDLSTDSLKRTAKRIWYAFLNVPYHIYSHLHKLQLKHQYNFYRKWYSLWIRHLQNEIASGELPSDLLSVEFKRIWTILGPPFTQIAVQTPGKAKKTIAIIGKTQIILYKRNFLNYILEKRNMYINEDRLLVFYNVKSVNVAHVYALSSEIDTAQITFKTDLGDVRVTLTPYREMLPTLVELLTKVLLANKLT